ncbi:RES family NAD+ phosphorylase [Mycolicibacter longobardus]|uniref:RES family NAD+ phosphorylase n=1 Tax=Mycolicibacter longobardus TaxID=1108812 RepID=UPI000D6A7BFF|nr:RES family NAD+ phosphorylase [Mycolicibacter longobardus]MCV7386306.1 RES family NAD+ phosphorylase [Mycolicibacter longobardus]
MPELPSGYRAPLPDAKPTGLRRRRIPAGTLLWRLDAQHPDQWDWDGFAEPRYRFDPQSGAFRTRYAATDLVGAFRERYRLTGLMIPTDHAGHHLVRLSAARHLRVLDLRTELNLDALGVDDQISTGQHDAVWATCQRLADAVPRWWPETDECPDAIVYRSRTTPETSVNYAFFAAGAFDVESWPLAQRPDVTADLVLRHGFTVLF